MRADADNGYGTESAGDGRRGKGKNPPCPILSGIQPAGGSTAFLCRANQALYTKPLFAIPANRFLFYPGHVEQRDFCDALSISPTEYALIDHPEHGVCLYHCGNARYLLQVQAPEFQAKLFGDTGTGEA